MTFFRFIRRALPAVCALVVMLASGPGAAHPGHDDAPEPVAGSLSPRTETHSDDFEVVAAVAAAHVLTLYLDRFATNEPIRDAMIEVGENGADPVKAEAQEDGTFLLRAPWLDVPGKHDLTFTIAAGDKSDLLAATLELPRAEPVTAAEVSPGGLARELLGERRGPVTIVLAFLFGAFTVLALQARGRWRAVSAAAALGLAVVMGGVALAHGGVDDGDGPAVTSPIGDAPRRLPNGAVLMLKDAQRLLAVRTVPAAEIKASRAVEIMGQVVSDPGAAGRVQSSQPGRIEPGEQGLAHVGQRVKAGDILAVVAPAIAAVERGSVGSQVADFDQQVRVAEQKVARLSGLAGSVPGKDIDDARAELAGARARRAALSSTLAGREVLRAPVGGVVSVAGAVAGQYVEGRDIIFEIVDPARLWIEAVAFDPASAAAIKDASAITTGGTVLKVELVGVGLTLRQGALPVQFRILEPPAGLAVGTPVTVIASIAADASGVALPRSAVVRMANGGSAVWDHVSAERFVSRPIRMQPLDSGRVLVLAGLRPGQRIVTQGADLLNQVR